MEEPTPDMPEISENGDSNHENGQESMENSEVEQNDESQPPTPPFSEPEEVQREEMEISQSDEILSAEQIEIETCRLCDEICEKMFNIFEDNPEGYQLIGLIKENLPIVLYKTDPLSKQVCEKCVLNLQVISGLKKRSRKTQEKYVEKLKTEADTTDKNVLLFLGCTGSKLVDDTDGTVDEDEEEEEELKDQGTSTEDLTILCANCKTSILDASTVNGEVELAADLHEIIRESLKKNRVAAGDESEKVLRRRKIQPLYQELEDSSCSSLTELPATADDTSQYDDGDLPSEIDSEDSQERPAKRRKLDKSSKEIQDEIDQALAKQSNKSNSNEGTDVDEDNNQESDSNESEEDKEKLEAARAAEQERLEQIKLKCEELFKEEPEFTFEPLSLMQITLNFINTQNIPDYTALPYEQKPTKCHCKVCNEEFKNVRLLALHEETHMDVDFEERIDNPNPWPKTHPHAKIRNKWLTCFDENGQEEEEEALSEASGDVVEDAPLLMEDKDRTMEVSKKDELILVDMKPMVNGLYLGDYTKEERKAFYQCMRIGGQTKRFCALCRYCFKDNWAIESHYFSFACHYTCRYCGMRFNKQRHRFDEHTNEHKKKNDTLSDKIYTASKVNNTMPKIVQPDKVKKIIPGEPEKPREIRLEDYSTPPVITKGGYDQRGTRYSHLPGERQPTYHQNVQIVKVKEEPKDNNEVTPSQNKTQNQAYFCRKCYKVFFKLDEFNAHSKNCDYNSYVPATRSNPNATPSPSAAVKAPVIKVKQEITEKKSNGEVNLFNSAGRPMRTCAKDIGPYKDEVYIPKQILNETVPGPPQSFICHICGTPFPTIYSRNSHMRIHKGETQGANGSPNSPNIMQQNILKQRLQQQQQQQHHNFQMQRAAMHQQKQIQQQKQLMQKQFQQRQLVQTNYSQHYDEVRVKEEPVSFEPMVEIHEGHESPSPPPHTNSRPSMPSSFGNAISLTPIVKKPALNPNILKLVENNPNISLVSKKQSTPPSRPSSSEITRSNIIKNAGGYQGPYAPTSQQRETTTSYITVSPNLMPNDDNKSYKCSSCWEAFSNKSHLYFHKKNQCEGSRFPCPFCKKRFGTEAAYSSHIFYSHPE